MAPLASLASTTPQADTRAWPTASNRFRTCGGLAALAAIAVVSRLPQLISPNLLLDGDECTLGLMAKHLAQGKEFPVFFWGQHYGLSLIEAAAGALAFLMVGTNAIALKLAMLALWTVGVLFLFLALSRILGTSRSFWIASVLLVSPAWAVWSMKARGGYITSFTASAVLAWLLVQDRERHPIARWIVAGALSFVIYLAQPLWLPGVLPILVVVFLSRPRVSYAASYLAVPAAAIVLVTTWSGAVRFGNPDPIASLPVFARQIYLNLTGSYYLWWPLDPPGPVTRILGVVWCAVIPAAALMQLYRLLTRRHCLVSHVLFLSVCSTLVAEWLLLRTRDARYLLPLSALLVLLVGVEIVDLIDRRLLSKPTAFVLTGAMLLLGSLSMREFAAFTFLWKNPPNSLSEARRLQRVVGDLKSRGVGHVFSMNGLLEWQLMFYSDEALLARFPAPLDRYPSYLREVNRALANGEPVAVVGYTSASGAPGCWDVPICTGGIENLVTNPEAIVTVNGKYFIYVGAGRELLEKLHFQFTD